MIQTLFGSLEQKPGFFDRMKQAVTRTRENLTERIDEIVAFNKEIDRNTLDELEATLIAADLGTTTTHEVLEKLRDKADRKQIKDVAELKRLLRPRVESETEYGQTLVELVIRRLKDQGYLSDAKYAAAYSSFRRDNEKFGRLRVITDLKTKGVHGEVIEKAVASVYEDVSDEKQARAYLRRKRLEKPENQKQAARIFRQLARAGFTSRTIFKILKKWNVDEETLTALDEGQRFEC